MLEGMLPMDEVLRQSGQYGPRVRVPDDADVQTKLPLLATYMGHVSVLSTQYYLRYLDPLAGSAAQRFADRCASLVTPAPRPGDLS